MTRPADRFYGGAQTKPASSPAKPATPAGPSMLTAAAPKPAPQADKALGDMTLRQFADLGETMLNEALGEYDFHGHTREKIEEAAEAVIKQHNFGISDLATPDGRAKHRAMVAQSLGARRRRG